MSELDCRGVGRLASDMARALAQRLSVWRDLGYAIGALMAGLIADQFGLAAAIAAVGALTFVFGVVVAAAMQASPAPASLAA